MKNLSLTTIITASVIALTPFSSVQANVTELEDFEPVSRGVFSVAKMSIIDPSETDPALKENLHRQDQAAAEQTAYENSWIKYSIDTTKWLGGKALSAVGNTAYGIAKFAVAYTASEYMGYSAINMGADVFAYAATPVLGPVAPAAAGIIKGANLVSEYIPGVREFKHTAVAFATKDYVLPTMVGAAKVAYAYGPAVVSSVASAGKSLYNWFAGA